MMRVQAVGLSPFTVARATYNTTGRAVSFRRNNSPLALTTTHVTFRVYTGVALVALDGSIAGPFIELGTNESFDFPIATEALYIKGLGGDCEVAVVAAINPIEEGA